MPSIEYTITATLLDFKTVNVAYTLDMAESIKRLYESLGMTVKITERKLS